jgi:predicted metalloprotease with PDZ domain
MGTGWSSLRRGQDYYDEGALIWLRADTIIREQTQNRLSLDDFLRSFFGQRDSGPVVITYTREDLEASLAAICPFDWHAFFETHVYQANSKPPTDGLEAAGWRLVYNAMPNNEPFYSDFLAPGSYYAWYSVGMAVKKDGTISDVVPGTPAYDAELGPKMKILAVDGHPYSNDALSESIAHPRDNAISLVVRNFDSVQTLKIKYTGGIRYPHLERIAGIHDYLSEILEPRSLKEH